MTKRRQGLVEAWGWVMKAASGLREEGGQDEDDAPSLQKTGPHSSRPLPKQATPLFAVGNMTSEYFGGHSWFLFILSVLAFYPPTPEYFGLEQTLGVSVLMERSSEASPKAKKACFAVALVDIYVLLTQISKTLNKLTHCDLNTV